MNISITILNTCSSGGHITLRVTTPKGIEDIVLHKSDFDIEPDEWKQDLAIILRNFIKESGLTNWSQIKTAIESKIFKL